VARAAHPVLSMEAIRKNDPKLQELSAVLGEWHRMLGPERVTAAEVIQAAIKRDPVDLTEFVHPEFREALLAVDGQGGAINSRKLGKWLSANRDRIVEVSLFDSLLSTPALTCGKYASNEVIHGTCGGFWWVWVGYFRFPAAIVRATVSPEQGVITHPNPPKPTRASPDGGPQSQLCLSNKLTSQAVRPRPAQPRPGMLKKLERGGIAGYCIHFDDHGKAGSGLLASSTGRIPSS